MGGYVVTIWTPPKVRGKEIVETEIDELCMREGGNELGEARWWNGEPVREHHSLLMFYKGFKYLPEIMDSMIYGLIAALDKLTAKIARKPGLEWPPAARYWRALKEELKSMYPHAAELMGEVNMSIKRFRVMRKRSFCSGPSR